MGAQIEALDSTSGWAAMTDKRGEFVLRDLTWHPRAAYTLIIAANEHKSRQIQIVAPATYPEGGVIEFGELDFERSCQISTDNLPGRNSITYLEYDLKNDLFYRRIVAELAAGKRTDEEKIQALSSYVATKLDAYQSDDRIESPRRVLENGSAFCGKLAFALATLAEAVDYRARLIDLIDGEPRPNAHMVTEIYYGDRWHLYDPTAGVGFHDRSDRIASYRDLRLDPKLVSSAPPNHLPATADMPETSEIGIYQSGLHHYYYLKRTK
jgi:transglutaminase-like putative cysteine protease